MRGWLVLLGVIAGTVLMPVQAMPPEPFAQAQLQDEQKRAVTDYRLVVSGLTRTQATTVPTRELRIRGDLWRRVWAVEQRFTLQEVSDHFLSQLDDLETLYECRALDCGSSHFWANELFRNARLVGREQFQVYRVAMHTDAATDVKTLYVLYIMQRGTRQVMVNLDIVTTRDAVQSERDLSGQIRQQLSRSHGWLPGFMTRDNQLDHSASDVLLTALKALSVSEKSRLYLMVHCYDSNDMTKNQQCSDRLASQLRAASFDGSQELNVMGQAALTSAPDSSLSPALRFVFWPAR